MQKTAITKVAGAACCVLQGAHYTPLWLVEDIPKPVMSLSRSNCTVAGWQPVSIIVGGLVSYQGLRNASMWQNEPCLQ